MATKAYFDNIQAVLLENLQTAKKSLYTAVAWITDRDIIRLLTEKAANGVRVEIMITDDEINRQIDFSSLQEAGGKLWRVATQENGQDMHHKFCVMDSHTVITGSYNWSRKAQRNFENITITDEDPVFASRYLAEFERIKRAFVETETGLNLWFIRERIEVLKRVLTMRDEEDINRQCAKLESLLPQTVDTKMHIELIGVEQIIQTIQKEQHKEALKLVKQYLRDNTETITIHPSNLLDLETLHLEYHTESIDFIKNLKNLRKLYAYDNEITDFFPLLELKKLKTLHIHVCFGAADFSFLKKMISLKELVIAVYYDIIHST